MRLAGTACICIVAAFGAAFLVARAVDHQTPARAATPQVKPATVAAVTPRTAPHKVNVELVSQFAPLKASLRPRPKPRPKHKPKPATPAPTVSAPSTTSTPTFTEPTPVTSAPVQSAPSSSSTPTQSSSGSSATHHKKSGGSSGGSGTTTIGG